MFQSNKSLEIRRELLKALGKTVSPYYYNLSLNYAKKLLNNDINFYQTYKKNVDERPVKTLAIV